VTGAGVVNFTFQDLLNGGPQSYVTGISDLNVAVHDGTPVLYAASGAAGGVSCYRLLPNGTAQLEDQDPYSGAPVRAAPTQLEEMSVGADTILISLGWHDSALRCFDLDASGQITGTGQLTVQGGMTSAMVEMTSLSIGGKDMVYSSHWGQQGLFVYEMGAGDQLIQRAEIGGGAGPQGTDLVAIEAIERGGQDYLVTASAFGNAVTSYRLDGSGIPVEVGRLDTDSGLSINAPQALVPVVLDGTQYLLVAAAGSSSLSVLELGAGGALSVVDHVLDDLNTRFDGVTVLDAVTIGDRVFVVAGGADDGLSLFTLLPGGRLLHLDTIADSAGMALANIAALELHVRDGIVDVFVSSNSEVGITRLSVDPGTLLASQIGGTGDDVFTGSPHVNLMSGGAGDDNLDGWNGDDILMDGAGSDTLRGGLGADIFVLAADGETDTIVDFTLGVDRLDLSAAGRFYSLSSLTITPTTDGAIIVAGNEEVRLISADYMPLTAAMFTIADLVDIAHYAPLATPPGDPNPDPDPKPDPASGGTSWHTVPSAILSGAIGPRAPYSEDTFIRPDLSGQHVASYVDATRGVGVRLDGGAAWGGATGDVLAGIEGVIGSGFRDTLVGNDDDNLLQGGGGDDTLWALGGNDALLGGDGADRLYGQGGNDLLQGGLGADSMDGGDGFDVASYVDATGGVGVRLDGIAAWGAATGDVLAGIEGVIGSAFRDTLVGNDDDNLLQGGGGPDTLYGQGGFDVASYVDATGGVGVRLDGIAAWGGATGDVLVDIEGLIGSGFRDTLVGNDDDNLLQGGGGDDTLWALGGNDALLGGDGADRLYGQGGSDRFIFADGFGTDTILDFDATDADEQIDLSALSTIASYTALTGNSHMSQQGADVVIDDFAGNTITLASVQLGDLDSTDFLF